MGSYVEEGVLLGRREVDDGCAAVWEGRRESGGLLGGRGLCCWAGERGGRVQDC